MIEALQWKNLGFTFKDGLQIFNDVTFDFPLHRNIAVRTFGNTGRSTLLKIMTGLLLPQTGNYLINGSDVAAMSFEEFLPWRQRMGYGFDMGGLLNNRTLRDNMLLPLQYHRPHWIDDATLWVDQLLNVFGLTTDQNKRPAEVTGAKRKACCVARAFVMQPEIVFLDDPTQGLSEGGIETLARLMDRFREREGLKHVYIATDNEQLIQYLKCETLTVDKSLLSIKEKQVVGL